MEMITSESKLKILGDECKRFRIREGYTQSDVAKATGFSRERISAFECGRSRNLIIFSWYVGKGFKYAVKN